MLILYGHLKCETPPKDKNLHLFPPKKVENTFAEPYQVFFFGLLSYLRLRCNVFIGEKDDLIFKDHTGIAIATLFLRFFSST
jgi:hypothetical protein